MEDNIERRGICGEVATHCIGVGTVLPICDNLVCYQASVDLVSKIKNEITPEGH
jgi:hypothetical protein